MSALRTILGLVIGGGTGALLGNRVYPETVLDIDMPLTGKTANQAKMFLTRPGMFVGGAVGGVIGILLARRFFGGVAGIGQAQPMNNGSVQAAITWANGHTQMVGEEEVVQGEHLMQYLTDGVLDIAEQNFGQSAGQMFPAKLEVMHGKDFYQGMMTIDDEGMPELTLNNISVTRPSWAAASADRKYANRSRATKMALDTMHAGKIPLEPGVAPNDFYMPIPE